MLARPFPQGAPAALAALAVFFAVLSLAPNLAFAHTPSETYFTLTFSGTNLAGRWDVALRDLHQGMGLEPEAVKKIVASELQQREEALALDICAGVQVRADDVLLGLAITDYTTLSLNGIEYARLLFEARGLSRAPTVIEINPSIAFRIDTNMHGIFRFEHNGRTEIVAFNAQRPGYRFRLDERDGGWARWTTFVWEGVWHIWVGLDHLLFLVALLLPAVLKRENGQWIGVERFREGLFNVLKIVTAFTLAHSITLTLSVLNVMRLPTRFVESVIAASVALAALNNLWSLFRGKSWLAALGFGLIHGFGFANVLVGMDLVGRTLASGLVGFNIGVELGQIAIVLVFMPLAYDLRGSMWYTTITLKYGSLLIVIIAIGWLVERVIGQQMLGF